MRSGKVGHMLQSCHATESRNAEKKSRETMQVGGAWSAFSSLQQTTTSILTLFSQAAVVATLLRASGLSLTSFLLILGIQIMIRRVNMSQDLWHRGERVTIQNIAAVVNLGVFIRDLILFGARGISSPAARSATGVYTKTSPGSLQRPTR
jgi:hypothetical protein